MSGTSQEEFPAYVRDVADQLAKLAHLRDQGIISAAEFEHGPWPGQAM